MIVEINGNRKRKENFYTCKIIGSNEYELHYRNVQKKIWGVNIPLEHGGRLATSIGGIKGDGTTIKRYPISFAKLPQEVKTQVLVCIEFIEKYGDPMENDEPIF